MDKLKAEKAPFTSSEEVEECMESDINPKIKQAMLKREVQFARHSSMTLPRVDPLLTLFSS